MIEDGKGRSVDEAGLEERRWSMKGGVSPDRSQRRRVRERK